MREFVDAMQFSRFLNQHIAMSSPVLDSTVELMAKNIHRKVRENFGNLDKLQELKPATIDRKSKMGFSDPSAPLVASGELRDSMELYHEGHEAGVGTEDMKMVYHEYGTMDKGGHNPPRPVLQISIDETTKENQEAFKAGVAEALGVSIRRTLF